MFFISLLKIFFDFEYPQKSALENEIDKLVAYLKTRNFDDIKTCYRIVKTIFEQVEENYQPKRNNYFLESRMGHLRYSIVNCFFLH